MSYNGDTPIYCHCLKRGEILILMGLQIIHGKNKVLLFSYGPSATLLAQSKCSRNFGWMNKTVQNYFNLK